MRKSLRLSEKCKRTIILNKRIPKTAFNRLLDIIYSKSELYCISKCSLLFYIFFFLINVELWISFDNGCAFHSDHQRELYTRNNFSHGPPEHMRNCF